MPALQPGSLVLVTGASGFLGSHVLRDLFADGFKVRAAVRDKDKGEYLLSMYPDNKDALEYVIVEDLAKPGAYDAALPGVAGALLVAAPMNLQPGADPSHIIEPSINGITGFLDSAAKIGSVERVVFVGSTVATDNCTGTGGSFTDKDWNDDAVAMCKKDGAETPGKFQYYVYAERALWDWMGQHKARFDAVSILPGLILGPLTQYKGAGDVVGRSFPFVLPYLKPGAPEDSLSTQIYTLSDVRDLAFALVRALTVPEAGGERLVVADEPLFTNDFAIAAQDFPSLPKGLTKGRTDAEFLKQLDQDANRWDGDRAAKLLGFKYRPKKETLHDAIESALPHL